MIFLCFLSFFPFANSAHAGLILQHPTYTGLNQGLAPLEVAAPRSYGLATLSRVRLLTGLVG
ncbi:hypothetical protein A2930_03780 [Candidatus Giovannonibacteria bacterium RIFCSPLOWO2_01_FULL_45_34]|uniref:Uncharacterized protein n=1 Tax=Candidatus Giovannonibacteria bacterium RIFCSPLOWO2_01_FULL_45_34 TaxID=1798351 RepID=A0A1F5WZ19_9BACT|nr:MAG: hypothetical protein A2930_03780 [Candidatus Giovannonibacteria bacterium RIFCSPLOWO2_01_FULL_45_34]